MNAAVRLAKEVGTLILMTTLIAFLRSAGRRPAFAVDHRRRERGRLTESLSGHGGKPSRVACGECCSVAQSVAP